MQEGIKTPFDVEYARSSDKRGGAPTLVPVKDGTGAKVPGQVFALKEWINEAEAADRLWRREIDAIGTGRHYDAEGNPGQNTVVVDVLKDFAGLDRVLYAKIASNIDPLDGVTLARLARKSLEAVAKGSIRKGRDGISYLIKTKAHGAVTPLSTTYEQEIERESQTQSLQEAVEKPLSQWLEPG